MKKNKNLKMAVQCELRSVNTFHGTDYYIQINFPGLAFSHLVPTHQEEQIKEIFKDNQIQTISDLEKRGKIPTAY